MIKFLLNLSLLAVMARDQWKGLYESGDLDQLLGAENKIYVLERMEKACELERKNRWFPENCLKLWNQFLLDVNNKKSGKNYKNLEKMCKTRVDEIVEIEHLQSLLDLLLPGQCRQALQMRGKDLEYIQDRSFSQDINRAISHGKNHHK